jgi:2-phospho-L-lactate guanylyltransferase
VIVGTATGRPAAGGSGTEAPLGPSAVLVPVKAFSAAKRRLGAVLGDAERRALVVEMAERVLAAAAPLPTAVVCDDTEVADWARARGVLVVWEPGRGLNGAVEAGVTHLCALGAHQVTVAHADLPGATGIGTLAAFDGVTMVPDHRGDGTTVLRVPAAAGFRFSYGPGSFARHRAECARLGLAELVLDIPALARDVDTPADLRWR